MVFQMIAKKLDWLLLLNRKNRLYRHILFWIAVTAFLIVLKEYPPWLKRPAEITCVTLQILLTFIISCYTNNYFVLPFFFRKKTVIAILLYCCQIVLLTFLMPVLLDLVSILFVRIFDIQYWVEWKKESFAFKIIAYTAMASIFKIAKDSILSSKEQKEAELRHLKSQLNPHFLFNTFNNLYGLAVTKSDELPHLMLRFSDLLRYSIYVTDQPTVKLEKELSYIKGYIELERIRVEKEVNIEFTQTGNFTESVIAPLMLIVFIENSFKHFSYPRNGKGYIFIDVNIHQDILRMNVKNSLDPSLFKIKKEQDDGIGIENVRKRLNMLYLNKYDLEIKHEADFYQTHLKVDLK